MSFLNHSKGDLFFVCVCLCYIGRSSAQANNQDTTSDGKENYNQGSSYVYYQTPDYPRDCQEVRNQCSSSPGSGVYLIRPHGYPEPFEAFCDNEIDSGGWTVIHRRLDTFFEFDREWDDYKQGFGFTSSQFWLGNVRLSFLTNQNLYELRIDMTLSDGASSYVKYNSFRITDELGNFTLLNVGEYSGDAGSVLTPCPQNLVYGNCKCMPTCYDPTGTTFCQNNCDLDIPCVCPEGYTMKEGICIALSQCICYIPEEDRYISTGETYVNAACTEKCTCNGNQLDCDQDYACSSEATCKTIGGVRQCYCNEGYGGDGENCAFTDCNDVLINGHTQDGVYPILPLGWPGSPFNVFCNMTIDGGGWIVFQRRNQGTTDFNANWENYKNGFGDIEGDFWLGNERLHYITQQHDYELRVDLSSSKWVRYAKYSLLRIDSESNKYYVTDFGSHGGDLGNVLILRNSYFSTYDQDNDGRSYNCAEEHHGGWWYGGGGGSYTSIRDDPYNQINDCWYWRNGSVAGHCTRTNLNGEYNGGNGQNINWSSNCHIKYVELKIRRFS